MKFRHLYEEYMSTIQSNRGPTVSNIRSTASSIANDPQVNTPGVKVDPVLRANSIQAKKKVIQLDQTVLKQLDGIISNLQKRVLNQ